MKIFELIKIAFSSIISNKMRSLLTMLGLIIGISSVVTILAIGDGSQSSIEDNLSSLGLNTVSVSYERNVDISPTEEFNNKDIEAIEEIFGDRIISAMPSYSGTGTIISNIDETTLSLSGSDENLKEIEDLTLFNGRSIAETDLDNRRNVILIDDELAVELFGTTNIAGEKIQITAGKNTNQFIIIGVYEKADDALGYSASTGYIPYTTADKILNKKGEFDSMSIAVSEDENVEDIGAEITSLLEIRHQNIGLSKYKSFSLSSQIDMVTDVMSQITLLVSAIAGISLVVGGIGVMNIMLVSVTERTREIGIRKALGAKRADILTQFLIEAVTICMIGGLIGVLFGAGFTQIAENIMGTPMSISMFSVLLATSFSTLIGVVFGVYPANKASKLDPIEALRYE